MGHQSEQTIEGSAAYQRLANGQLVAEAVAEHLGPRSEWAEAPGGYGDRVDLALVDTVSSIRLSYGRERQEGTYTGVRAIVWRYRVASADLTGEWLEALAGRDPGELAQVLHNRSKLHGGPTKAEAIVQAARGFVAANLTTRSAILASPPRARSVYGGVKGLGPITFEYFSMLLGFDGVKAEPWIVRFASRAVRHQLSPDEAADAVRLAAEVLSVGQSTLDHAIWSFCTTTGLDAMAPVPGER